MTIAKNLPHAPEPDRAAKRREYIRRYRLAHPVRFDYVPSADALCVIKAWVDSGVLNRCIAGVLDKLILAGDEALRSKG